MRTSVIKQPTIDPYINHSFFQNLLKKALLGLTVGLVHSSLAVANLPESVEAALNDADISSDDISIVITPVKHLAFSTQRSNSNLNKHSLISVLEPITASEAANIQRQTDDSEGVSNTETEAEETSDFDNRHAPANADVSNLNPNGTAVDTDEGYDEDLTLAEINQSESGLSESRTNQTNTVSVDQYQPLSLPIRHLPDMPRTPASTMKLIPTFIALDMLGEDYVWLTEVYHTGFVFGNTLYGDLIIKGSGDPKMTHQRLKVLMNNINKAGIRHIKGDIVLDASIFRKVGKDPAAFDNDPLRPYNASPDGFLINFSSLKLTTVPLLHSEDSRLAQIFYAPKLADYQLPTFVPLQEGSCSSAIKSLRPVWTIHSLKFQSNLPKSCDVRTFYLAYPNAKDFAKKVVKQQWLALGNTLSGDIINTEHPNKTKFNTYLDMSAKTTPDGLPLPGIISSSLFPFMTYKSLPLSHQIHDINHYSNNVMTEQLTLSLPFHSSLNRRTNSLNDSAEIADDQNGEVDVVRLKNPIYPSAKYSDKIPSYADYPSALSTIDHWWQSRLSTPPPYLTNGSGLCRECTVTADNLAELLEYAYHHPSFDTYLDSLGVAGMSGTIKQHADRLPNSAAIGRAWIKTGTLDNVTAMAGYIHGQSGQDYVLVSIINTPEKLNTYQARYALDTLIDWTAKH